MIALANTDTAPRIRLDVPAAEYHRRQLGVVTTGALKAALRTPAHYRAWVDAPDSDTPELRFGRLVHQAVFEPLRYRASTVVMPEWGDRRFKEEKAKWERWQKEHAGKEWLEAADAKAIDGIRDSLQRHPLLARLLGQPGALTEATIEWTDEETGLACKCRPDWWHRELEFVCDLKTTVDASPRRFGWACHDFGYAIQQAHYMAGIEALGERADWLFAATEKDAPFAAAVYRLDEESLADAREARRNALNAIARGIETGAWPAYGDGIETLTLPRRRQ